MENNYKADGKSDITADKTPEFDESETMFDLDICSATDCTGLIPALPQSDGEITSYEQLYHFLPRAKNESEKDCSEDKLHQNHVENGSGSTAQK